jgi:hypothetical protein
MIRVGDGKIRRLQQVRLMPMAALVLWVAGPCWIAAGASLTGNVVAESQTATETIGIEPTRIPLRLTGSGDKLVRSKQFREIRFNLVLEGLHARQPPGVLFEVHLGHGASSSLDDAGIVGTFNLFERQSTDGVARHNAEIRSFDVSERVTSLLGSNLGLMVTIIPLLGPSPTGSVERTNVLKVLSDAALTLDRVTLQTE